MPPVKVRGQSVDVDIKGELESFEWTRARWSYDKLIAASPFRYDRSPSFFVNLDGDYAGTWGDSGYYDEEWKSGGFVKLLSFLRNETYEETEEYLLSQYSVDYGAELKMPVPKLQLQRNRQSLNERILAPYQEGPGAYLLKRGITAEVQRQLGFRFGKNSVVIPWRRPDGRLANVKYRLTNSKTFWYERGAAPISSLLWGLDVIRHRGSTTAVFSEAELDGASWVVAGYPAIANGGVAFNAKKRDLILRSPIEELIIATDNDKAGEKLRTEVERSLRGYVRIKHAYVGGGAKDANEALVKFGAEALVSAAERASPVRNFTYFSTR